MEFGIVGTGRCGTSVLRRMLNGHPELFVFPETHWIPKMFEFFGTGPAEPDTLIGIILRTRFAHGDLVTPLDVDRLKRRLAGVAETTVAEFCDVVGGMFADEAGKSRWADKTPDYGPHMSTLQALWPRCRFLHVIRNGGDVARSMSHHPGFRWMAAAGELWWSPASFNDYYTVVEPRDVPVEAFGTLWRRRLVRIRDEASRLRPGTYLELRYEDLVADPEATLLRVCRFLSLDAQGAWFGQAVKVVDRSRSGPSDERVTLAGPDEDLLVELGYGPEGSWKPRPGDSAPLLPAVDTAPEAEVLRGQLAAVLGSRSWRITAPLRRLAELLRRR
jgi:hypothetical protein